MLKVIEVVVLRGLNVPLVLESILLDHKYLTSRGKAVTWKIGLQVINDYGQPFARLPKRYDIKCQ